MKTITSSKIILYGQSGDGREETIEKLASDNNHNISTFDLSSLSGLSENIIINSIQDIFSNSLLYNSFILIKSNGLKMLFSEKQFRVKASLKGLMQTHNKSIFVLWDDGSSCPNELFGAFSEIRIPLPNKSDQKRIWELELSDYLSGDEVSYTVDSLSTSYCMTHGEIHDLVEKCIQQNPEAKINLNLILSTIKNTRDFGLDGLAMLTPTTLGMNDIVLNENQISSMKEMLAYARHSDIVFEDWGFSKLSHSTGICALFYGPPGTGKTLSAGVIAHELKKAMYVVDLSRVIDKYVGETEKQLAKIFEYAQKSQSVLLFDEADSLFAKRTGVKSSNDRYANLEVNYLLQKIESFRGICILTTNNVDQLDEALARRIPFKISFNLPDEVQREKLWRILIPPKAPVSDIDFNALSEAFEMSGGHIRNSVLRACIRASSECIPISTTLLWDAAETEYREMGHAITFNSYERFTDHSDYC